jgi:hypothetical protein
MENEARPDTQLELEIEPLVCVHCGTEVVTEVEPWPEACPNCQRPFDLDAQFAYSRGRDAFTAGQELIIHISPSRREKDMTTDDEMEGLHYYIQAYTALQRAFQGKIAEVQRRLGIEMMAAMARVFLQHGMVSQLEMAYWSNLLIELNTLLEWVTLKEKIETSKQRGLPGFFLRWRWRLRRNQLETALLELDRKIRLLERQIAFVDPPNARRRDLPS